MKPVKFGIVRPSFAVVALALLACCRGGLQKTIVQPILYHRFPVATFTLGEFVFMMRKEQIQTATVDIERFAQQRPAHCGTFNMPTRPTLSPRAVPSRFACFRPFPKGKIAGVPLFGSRPAPFALLFVGIAVA